MPLFFFAGLEPEEGVEGAKGNDRSEQEDNPDDEQDNAEDAAYDSAEVEIGKQGSDEDANDAVCCGHVLFHNFLLVGEFWN